MKKTKEAAEHNETGAAAEAATKTSTKQIQISAPNIQELQLRLMGDSYLATNHFSAKARNAMMADQEAGSTARSKKKREPKDFNALFREAQYRSPEGWSGINASALRNAMISACRTVGFKMTLAKLSVFVVADGFDAQDGTPLLRIWGPEPENWKEPVRLPNLSFDIRPRPRWRPGQWELRPRIRFDADQFTTADVANLIARVGMQIGLGEGRPDSKMSAGIGYGLFHIEAMEQEKAA